MLKDVNPELGDVMLAQVNNLRKCMTLLKEAEAEGETFAVRAMLAKRVSDAINQLDRTADIVDKALDDYLT